MSHSGMLHVFENPNLFTKSFDMPRITIVVQSNRQSIGKFTDISNHYP